MAKHLPNLIIGCGGSGLTTLAALNRLLVQNPQMLPRLADEVHYLVVDTDVAELNRFEEEIKKQMGAYSPPFTQRVQLSYDINILNEIIQPNFVEPFWRQPNAKGLMRLHEHWWFDNAGNPFVAPLVTNLINGAGQCPPASYGLAWFRLGDRIESAVDAIISHMVTHGYGNETQLKDMNLIVVAGLSGGTGRGCWNLIAFKVREYLLRKYKVPVPPVGIFFDANVYSNVSKDNEENKLALEVNSLTGLSELSCWLANGRKSGEDCFRYRLPSFVSPDKLTTDVLKIDLDIDRDPRAGSPVNSAFLVCGKNRVAELKTNQQYHEMAGAALYALIAHPKIPAKLVNEGDPYNSLAAATFEVDTLHLQNWYETRARNIALGRLVSSGEDVSPAKDAFFRATPINAYIRALADLRPNPTGTLFQRMAAAILNQKKYRQAFSNMRQDFPTWKLDEAVEAVTPLLTPLQGIKTIVKQVLDEMGLSAERVDSAVVAAMKAVYKGEGGQKPSIGRALEFLKLLKSEIDAARALSPQAFQMTPVGEARALDGREAIFKTIKAFSKRTLAEMLRGIGYFNQDEIDQLVKEEGGQYVGVIPSGILAVNYPQLKVALEEAFLPALKRIERLIAACEQFANCCREASAGFSLEEAKSAGGKVGDDPFRLLFSTPDRIDETLYGANDVQRYYRRVLRPIVASRADAESLVADSVMIGAGMEDFIGKSIEDGSLEKLAAANDSAMHRNFVGSLMDQARASVRLSSDFLAKYFSFEQVLAHNREYWNQAIAAAMGSGVRLAELKNLFLRTLGATLESDPRNPAAPLVLPPVEKLRLTIAASLACTCSPWWNADSAGAHHSVMLFLPFECGENATTIQDEIAEVIREIKSNPEAKAKIEALGLDTAKGGSTQFCYLAFIHEGLKLSDVEKDKGMHLLDKVESLKHYENANVNAWMQKVERADGESIFSQEDNNKGIGYVSPIYIREKTLASYRWCPWLHEDEAEAQAAENKALDALLYAFLGHGMVPAEATSFAKKLEPYGWTLPVIQPGKNQSYLLTRKTYSWNGSAAEPNIVCDWRPNKRLCTSACNLYTLLQGKGKTGLSGAATEKDVEEGNKLRMLLLAEKEIFDEHIASDLGSNDIGKLKRALVVWLAQLRDEADEADKPVFDALLKRAQTDA